MSMNTNGENGNLLEIAAQKIIENAPEKDKYSLLTNDEIRSNISKKELERSLKDIKYTSNTTSYQDKINTIQSDINNKTKTSYKYILISDFQNFNKKIINKFTNVTSPFSFVKLNSRTKNNISIDSVYASKPTATNIDVIITLKNIGDPIDNVPVSLLSDNSLIAKTSVSINDAASTSFTIPLNEKINGQITIDDAQLQFDNNLYFNINSTEKINVLSINMSDDDFLKRVYTNTEFIYSSVELKQLNYSDLDKQNLILH